MKKYIIIFLLLIITGLLTYKYFFDIKKQEELRNDEIYKTYDVDDFLVKYPYWPNIDKKYLIDPKYTVLAVVNEGCNFVITKISKPDNMTFKEYIDYILKKNSKIKFPFRIISKNIEDQESHIRSDVTVGKNIMISDSYNFLSKKNNVYGIGFLGEKKQFEHTCAPIIQEVIESITIK
jgi:hypothetical protein